MPSAPSSSRPPERVGRITLNAPERLNAVDPEMCGAVADAVRAFDADPAVRVVALTGAGRGFCSGAPLSADGATTGHPVRRCRPRAGAARLPHPGRRARQRRRRRHRRADGAGLRLRARQRRGLVRPRLRPDRADARRRVDGARGRLDRPGAGDAAGADRRAAGCRDRGRVGAGRRVRCRRTGSRSGPRRCSPRSPPGPRSRWARPRRRSTRHPSTSRRRWRARRPGSSRSWTTDDYREGVAAFLAKRPAEFTGR